MSTAAPRPPVRPAWSVALTLVAALAPLPADAQGGGPDPFRVVAEGGREWSVEVVRHNGHALVPTSALETAGWTLETSDSALVARLDDGTDLTLRAGLPFARLLGTWVHLAHPPSVVDGELLIPVQLLADVLPDRLPDRFEGSDGRTLALGDASLWEAGVPRRDPPRDDGIRVVVIDPGHGGVDPGALGPTRTREKDVTLAIGRRLAQILRQDPRLEVYLTRDSDVLIPLWQRGELATQWKGDRPGIFLSIHANSAVRREVRGVETYFLSEARTEHEARVAALENSVQAFERVGPQAPVGESELGTIINELRNFDHQHWSSDLARRVQRRMAAAHPGPDRGVKQAPLAVITNALMPSVLVEVGFITHPAEERTLSSRAFHDEVAQALADAVRDFFERYPPGRGTSSGTG